MTIRRGVVSAHIDLDILNSLNILNRRQYADKGERKWDGYDGKEPKTFDVEKSAY